MIILVITRFGVGVRVKVRWENIRAVVSEQKGVSLWYQEGVQSNKMGSEQYSEGAQTKRDAVKLFIEEDRIKKMMTSQDIEGGQSKKKSPPILKNAKNIQN
jgi:hypothetical protein